MNVFSLDATRAKRDTIISGGHRGDEAVALLKDFYKGENPNAPEEKRKPKRK